MTGDDHLPAIAESAAVPEAARPYQPKPPLWRPAPDRAPSRLAVGAGIAAVLVVMGALWAVVLEHQLFGGRASATPVTVTAIERSAPADDDSPGHIVHLVELPDGRTARLTSERVFPPGLRLLAMVSRGPLTGRTIVTRPYVVVSEP